MDYWLIGLIVVAGGFVVYNMFKIVRNARLLKQLEQAAERESDAAKQLFEAAQKQKEQLDDELKSLKHVQTLTEQAQREQDDGSDDS